MKQPMLGMARKSWLAVMLVIVAFGGLGAALLVSSHAATPTAAIEVEAGTITASKLSDTTASGNLVVKFNPVSTGTGTVCSSTTTVKPDANNVGATTTGLTTVSGNVTVTTANSTIANEDIHGFLVIKANNVTVKNTIVRGGVSGSVGGFINTTAATGTLLDHVTVKPTTVQVSQDGIWGNDFTLLCSDVSGGVDGMKIASNSTIKNSYIHDLSWFANDPSQGGSETHNDAIQILNGTNILVQNNNLQGFTTTSDPNSAIQVTQDYGVVSGLTIQNNWADGGGCTFNISYKGESSLTNVYAYNNRFGRNSGYSGCAILIGTKVTLTQSGNVYDDNNQPISIQQHD